MHDDLDLTSIRLNRNTGFERDNSSAPGYPESYNIEKHHSGASDTIVHDASDTVYNYWVVENESYR